MTNKIIHFLCIRCKKAKAQSEFQAAAAKHLKNGYNLRCIKCLEQRWKYNKYGVVPAWFDRMSKKGCAICGLKTYKFKSINNQKAIYSVHNKRSLCVDHDHSTGKVRGLLCLDCNTTIARYFENKAMYKKVMKYLQRGVK